MIPSNQRATIVAKTILRRYLGCMKSPLVPSLFLFASFSTFAQTQSLKLDASTIFEKSAKSVVVVTCVKSDDKVVQGSGVILRSDGVIATNFHVCGNAQSGRVKLGNGDVYDDVSILETDERKDIAILKIKGIGLPALSMADSDQVKTGSTIYAIGAPLGLEGSITSGIVSSIRPVSEMFSSIEGFRVMQISTPVAHGSSGCPVLNDRGEVIGLVFAGRPDGQNLNAAIPINYVQPLVNTTKLGIALKQFPKSVSVNAAATPQATNDSISAIAGVYSGTWASEKFPVSGTLVITISLKDDVPTVRAVFTGSEVLNQEDFAAKITSIGGGVWKMEYVGKNTGITGTGIMNEGRFTGDYKFDPDDSGKWTLAVRGKDAAPLQVTPAPVQTNQSQPNEDDYEYGSLSELKGVKRIYVETGANTSFRDKIIKELEKLKLGLQIVGSEKEAECIIAFASKTIYEPWYSGSPAIVDKESGAGMVFLVGKQGKRDRLLYTFKDKQNTWLESKPITNFAKTVAKAFQDANR